MPNDNGYSEHPGRGRETFLVILFAVFVGGAFAVFLAFATGGFFAYAIVIGVGLGFFGWLHYLLWGRRFDRETRVERNFLESEEEPDAGAAAPQFWERRF